jgi:hypothetical protein
VECLEQVAAENAKKMRTQFRRMAQLQAEVDELRRRVEARE